MNCEKYQNLISPFLDGELSEKKSQAVQTHISMCADCAKLHEDFASVLNFCEDSFPETTIPPNSQALWCRINNIIESEIKPEIEAEEIKQKATLGFISQSWNSNWQFSPMQIASSVVGIALISSLLTVVGIKSFIPVHEDHTDAVTEPTVFNTLLAKVGIAETPQQIKEHKIKAQKSAINYWEKRVAVRKTHWDSNLQSAFDRNLGEIDKAVNQYTKVLEEDPKDKIYNEMLNSALDEKMEFLREFSEL